MEVLKIKDWLDCKTTQFIVMSEMIPNKDIFSSAILFSEYAMRLKDDVKFHKQEFIRINNRGAFIRSFCSDGIHLEIGTSNTNTHVVTINEIEKL